MHVLHVVGARPNFMKAAPLIHALANGSVHQSLIHTGQHYDVNMSDVFFRELAIPMPEINLQVGSGTHAQQTAEILSRLEPTIIERRPDLVLVYGDVNSTLAAALVCCKLLVPVGHVEAGLRSFDRTMPEEVNRVLTDQIADLLFSPSVDGNRNLAREGIAPEKIHFVGNVMVDTLVRMLPSAINRVPQGIPERYALITLHRPSNVDDPVFLRNLLQTLNGISADLPMVFAVHPRTRKRMLESGFDVENHDRFRLVDPLSYLEFIALQTRATLVITDSGGVQEETTFLRVPCLTVRENTERPVTVELGTNILVGHDLSKLRAEVEQIMSGNKKQGTIPPLWDGCAAQRIAAVIMNQPVGATPVDAPKQSALRLTRSTQCEHGC